MAKNKIQFETGISLQTFLSQYGTKTQCRKTLFYWRWPQGFICPECGHAGCCELKRKPLFQYNRCHLQTSVTAGTIFSCTKLPLTTGLLGIYFITQFKVSYSALSLSRIIGISYNTALLMKHKIQQVMKERDDGQPLTNYVQLDDAYWGGKKRDGIRGRGATGKIPFVTAVSTDEYGHPQKMSFSQVKAFSKKAIDSWASNHLSRSCFIVTDDLACFKALKSNGRKHTVIITGGGSASVKIPDFKWIKP